MLNPFTGYLDAEGKFDPRLLPLTEVSDRDGKNVLYVYLRPAYRQAWFLAENPVTGPIRLVHSMHQDPTGSFCEARIVNVDEPEYLCDDTGQVRCIPDASGNPAPLRNPKHVLFSDRKYAKSGNRYDAHESAITGAIGRALARAGYGTESLLALLNDTRTADPEGEDGVVDTPAQIANDEQILVLRRQLKAAAERADVSKDEAQQLRVRHFGDRDLAAEDLRTLIDLLKTLGLEKKTAATPAGSAPATPPSTDTPPRDSADPAMEAKAELRNLQIQLEMTNEEVLAALRRQKRTYEPGDKLTALDYAAASNYLLEMHPIKTQAKAS